MINIGGDGDSDDGAEPIAIIYKNGPFILEK